jgi:hypothetical protein
MAAQIIVHPPDDAGRRRVDIAGENVGVAYGLADVAEFARRAGLIDPDVADPRLVEWRGGGPDLWA